MAPTVSIVIPAYNAESTLGRVVGAAMEACGGDGVIVVDAGSSDATAEVARELGVRVVQLQRRAGPAEARNFAVQHARSDVVLFIDSDCVPHSDVVRRVREAFDSNPSLVSLTGSYDDAPPDPGFFSQYMNLRHHFTHQEANQENATFWAGCGAVRRTSFLQVGGFDAERYPEPQIEDIELGLRLAPLGDRRLDPDLQVKHLKRWTLRSVVGTDIRSRAIPWSRLILEQGELPNDLNLRSRQRLAGAVAPLALLAVPILLAGAIGLLFPWMLGGWSGAAWPALLGSLSVIALSVFLSWGLVRCFARLRGARFAFGGWLFHQVHLTYSTATFALCWLLHRLRRRDRDRRQDA